MLPDAYGCAVANRFGYLLDDDADPFDLMSEAEVAKEEKKKKKEKEKEEEKEKEKERAKQRRPGQRESQRDRRLNLASSDEPNPVPGRSQPAGLGRGLGGVIWPGPDDDCAGSAILPWSPSGRVGQSQISPLLGDWEHWEQG